MSMDISDFYQTFFDEADELLADMEQHLLELDPLAPDIEPLNAIFRAAHSIKGGAATFGFSVLQETTHLLENLLDGARRQEMSLSTEIINLFLETKDIMQEQLDAYKTSQQPDAESFEYICQALRQLALEAKQQQAAPAAQPAVQQPVVKPTAAPAAIEGGMRISLNGLKASEIPLMLEELGNLGEVKDPHQTEHSLDVTLLTSASEDDISAVLCFVLEPEQISFSTPTPSEPVVAEASLPAAVAVPEPAPVASAAPPAAKPAAAAAEAPKARAKASESTSIRVAVEKVDQLINLVGELVITQSMLAQRSGTLDPVNHGDLLNSMSQLERNARDLQESVMSIRMMPMEYVFSRYPRLVRDLAGKLNKQVELTLQGSSTELDKSLIERIIDPLTHLVRNSLDHGIEEPATRIAAGKSAVGNLVLSAEHQGGNICIEVIDDGAGLNREKNSRQGRVARAGGERQHERRRSRHADLRAGLLHRRAGDRRFRPRCRHGRGETEHSGNGRPRRDPFAGRQRHHHPHPAAADAGDPRRHVGQGERRSLYPAAERGDGVAAAAGGRLAPAGRGRTRAAGARRIPAAGGTVSGI